MTLVPNSMFRIREAMKAIKVTGSRRSSRPAMRSLSQRESMSRASQRSMNSKMESGVIAPKGQDPRPMPMRTFMGLPLLVEVMSGGLLWRIIHEGAENPAGM